jgi:hypothetical protein
MQEYSPPGAGFRFSLPQGLPMEVFLGHLIHFALWVFFVIFAFAVVGVIAAVRWIVSLVTRTEAAVGTGIAGVENAIHHR